jgi:hypothetical protein
MVVRRDNGACTSNVADNTELKLLEALSIKLSAIGVITVVSKGYLEVAEELR